MTGPTETFHVHPDLLRTESDLWDKASPKMGEISNEAHFLHFNAEEGGLLSYMFVPSYHKAARMIEERCGEARDRMDEIRDRLRSIAAGYEARDKQNAQHIRKAAQPVR